MHAIVAAALKQRILLIILAGTMIVGGLLACRTLDIEAYRGLVPPEETERYITMPIAIPMAGIASQNDDGHIVPGIVLMHLSSRRRPQEEAAPAAVPEPS